MTPAEATQPTWFSFDEVRARVYESPCPPDRLPEYAGSDTWETVQAIFLGIVSRRITAAMNRTLADPGDIKEDSPKLFHPKGICAEANWEIFADSGYTGLFAAETRVPAIVRMSASGNNTTFDQSASRVSWLHPPRSFGLAVKLFPAAPSQKVRTCNLLLFDNTGLDGNPSPWYMRGARRKDGTFDEQYFLNWLAGNGPVSTGFDSLFSRFVSDARLRAIDALGRVDSTGRPVLDPRSPRFLRLIPEVRFPQEESAARWKDFRLELLDLAQREPLAFRIAVSEKNPAESAPAREEVEIGRLTLGIPVVSRFGDRQLHFSHVPAKP